MDTSDYSVKELAVLLDSADPGQRALAAEGLAQLGPECREACIELVRASGSDEATREWVSAALEEMGPPPVAAVDALVPLLVNDSPDVAYWAATLLGRLENQAASAGDSLAKVITSASDLAVRERAVWALGKIGCSVASHRSCSACREREWS